MNVTHLECAACQLRHEARRLHNLCRECGKPLLVRYDLETAARSLTKESLATRRADLWRYREVLPVEDEKNIISLGEGWTPLLRAPNLGKLIGIDKLYIKDESQNPTQSFKARGMSAAVSMAKELGASEARSAVRRKCSRRPGSLRGSCRARVFHLHAARYPARKCDRV